MSISSFCITFPLTSHLSCGLTHTFPLLPSPPSSLFPLSVLYFFPLSTGSQLHAESLRITELQGTVSKKLLHFLCMVFFSEALGGDGLV